MVALLGTNSFKEVCARAEAGDNEAKIVIKASGYQTAKFIGAMAAVLEGKVDAIILTGGMAHQESHVNYIKSLVGFIAPVVVYAGEDELRALAFNAILALDHQVEVKVYK
jgi:butyrate kinase